MATPSTKCMLLDLPLEIRLHIWNLLLIQPEPLTIKSLFIRDNYKNVFMTQQPKRLPLSILRVCSQVTTEILPVLYAQPSWIASCRLESLASQIGIANFCLIKHLIVDADDLSSIVGSLVLDLHENQPEPRITSPSVELELELELESRALMENMMLSNRFSSETVVVSQRRLRFANLEILEVDAYQTMALTSHGNRRTRLEGMRLCNFARNILEYHPTLNVLVQAAQTGQGGSDAVDLTMGRVRWRFVRGTRVGAPIRQANEHTVDLDWLEDMLRALVELDEDASVTRREKERVPGWEADGTFRQYLYLTPAVT